MSTIGPLPEVESLRSQVADLARELAERDESMHTQSRRLEQTMQDLQEQSHLLRTIIEGTASDTGDQFFTSLVTRLTASLNVRYALVGEVIGNESKTIRTLAVSDGGALVDNLEYDLEHAPCGTGLDSPFWCFEQGVQARFPHFPNLAALGVESHCGVSLRDKAGVVVGLLIVMDTKPLRNSERLKSLLEVFAARAAAELQRHRAERVRRETERSLRFTQFAVEHAHDCILWADDSQRFIYANEAACRSLGHTRDEVLTLNISDIAPDHDPGRFQRRLDQIEQGTPATYESAHRRKDGTEFPVEISVNYLEHEGRGYTCWILRDISERKRVEKERLRALHDLENIMETVPDFMFTLDLQGNMVKWNRHVEEVTGYSPEELLNKPALAFVPPEEQARTAAAIRRALTEGYAELDGILLTKDLRTIPYHWTGALLKDLSGTPIGITGVGRDVSEKHRAEEELRRQQRHLVDAQALAHLGSWEWDIVSGVVQWSDELYRIFGHEPGSVTVTYDSFLTSLHPDDHDRVLAAVNDALLGKSRFDVEYRIIRPDGQVRTLQARGDVFRDATKHPLIMSGTALDITERKLAEGALKTSEERWHLAVRGSNDGIWDWNIETDEVFFSTRWKTMRGYGEEELSNSLDEWKSRIHPDDLDRVLQNFDAYLANQAQEFATEYRVQKKDGSYIWILDRGVALRKADGTPTRMAGSETDITARKHAEQALYDSEQRLALATEGSNDILWDAHRIPDKPWNVPETPIWWSPRVREYLGLGELEPFENLGHWAARLHPEDRDRVIAQLAAHVEDRIPYDVEYRLRTNAGAYLWMRARGQAMWDEQGQPRRMSGSCQDITDRKLAEEALRESEARYRTLVELSPSGVFVFCEGQTAYVNQTGAKLMGATDVREILNRPTFEFIHPDYHEEVRQNIRRMLSGGPSVNRAERVYVKLDGTPVPVQVEAACITWNGKPAILGMYSDITERKQAEEALREVELRYRTIFEQAGAGVAQIETHSGRFVQVNRHYCEILGLTEAEMLATTFGALTHPDDLETDLEHMRRLLSGELPSFTMEKRYLRKDGRVVWVNLNVAPLWRPDERPMYHIAIVQDITDRKRAEDALRHSERQLRTVLDTLPIGVWFTDGQGQILYGNKIGHQIWSDALRVGLANQDSERLWWEQVEPGGGPHRWAIGTVMARGEAVLNENIEIETTGGDRKIIRNSAVPVRNEDGHILGAIVLNEDITDRVRAEKALQDNHGLLKAIMDAAVDIIFVKDLKGRYLHMNPAGARALGMTEQEVIGWDDYALWSQPLASSCVAGDRRVMETGEAVTVEEQATLDGKTVTFLTTKAPYRDPEGKLIGIIGVSRDITERKQAEEALRASEELFAKAFRSSPYPVLVSELETGRCIDANDASVQLFGYERDEVAGQTTADLNLWPTEEARKRFIDRLSASGALKNVELSLRDKRGNIRQCLVSSELIELHGKRCVVTVGQDITEQKKAEAALWEKHTFLTAIMDTAMDIIFVKNLSGRYLHMNPAGARIVGMPVEEVIGKDDDAIWPADLAACSKAADHQIITTGTAQTFEESTVLDGNRITYLTTKAPYRDANGKLIGIIGVAHDITQIKQSEEELRRSHAFIRQIIDTDPNFIFAKDRAGRFTLVNQAVADAYGTTVDELIGKSDADFNANEGEVAFFRQKDLEVMDRLEECFLPEEQITDSSGRIRWLQTVKRPIIDHHGRAIMVLGASTDITERKKMEETLRQRERDLRAALDERERISQDLHDGILQSLYAVGLGLETAKSVMSPKSRRVTGPPLDHAINQLNQVMHEIRNFIAGLESQILHGEDFASALRTMVRAITVSRPMKCKLLIDPDASQRISTEQALHLLYVVREALSNSLRHGQATGMTISLRVLTRSIRLSVIDNGCGFHPDRAHGIGNGLANMAARAEKMGGRFTVQSSPRQGAKIKIDLPK